MIRRLLFVAVLVALPLRADAAFSVISSVCSYNHAVSSSIDTTGADLILAVGVFPIDLPSTPLTDNQGNSYTTDVSGHPGNDWGVILRKSTPTTSATHTFTGGYAGWGSETVCILAVSGSAASPFDQYVGPIDVNPFPVTTSQIGSITPTQDNELLIGFESAKRNDVSVSWTIDSGFTIPVQQSANNRQLALAYKIQTTAAAANPTWTCSTNDPDNEPAAMASYKAVATASPPKCNSGLFLFGVGCGGH